MKRQGAKTGPIFPSGQGTIQAGEGEASSYWAGSECTDYTPANRKRKKVSLACEKINADAGRTEKTLKESMRPPAKA
jgi:hypothetical protein